MYTTDIQSNGSKWAGQAPDSIETLLQVLSQYPLRRDMTSCGDFIQEHPVWVSQGWNMIDENTGDLCKCYKANDEQPAPSSVHFSGNFYNVSHVFSIYTNDPTIIAALKKAIKENQKRDDYLSQPQPKTFEPHYILHTGGKLEYRTS